MDEIRKYEVDMIMKNLEWAETEEWYHRVILWLTEMYEETPHSEYLRHHLALALTGYAVGFKLKDSSWEAQKDTFESLQDALEIDPSPELQPELHDMAVMGLMMSALSLGVEASKNADFEKEAYALECVEYALSWRNEGCMKKDIWLPDRSLPAVASVMAFHLSGHCTRRGASQYDEALEFINKSLEHCRFDRITEEDYYPNPDRKTSNRLILERREIIERRTDLIVRMMETV